MSKGILLVLSGPSRQREGDHFRRLQKGPSGLFFGIQHHPFPRPGEIDGVHYHFITREAFEEKIASGGMLEYAEYCGNMYGTPRDKVEEQTEKGVNVMLDIETVGAATSRKPVPKRCSALSCRLRWRSSATG